MSRSVNSDLKACTRNDHLLDDERVNPAFRQLAKQVLATVRLRGLPVIVVEVFRSRGRQRMLYAQGRSDERLRGAGFTEQEIAAYRRAGATQDKPVVTHLVNPQKHGRGLAMDCAWLISGKVSWRAPEAWWESYGAAAKAVGLIWGGDWKMKDLPHVEMREAQIDA